MGVKHPTVPPTHSGGAGGAGAVAMARETNVVPIQKDTSPHCARH